MTSTPTLQIRNLERNDPALRLVESAWRISYWEGSLLPDIDYSVYLKGHAELMRRCIARGQVRVVEFEGIDEVLGFAVVEESPLHGSLAHYCYVKAAYRRQHLATALLKGAQLYTQATKAGQKVAKALGLVYNPFAVL